jgi:DNA alkylation damage repair protein AlkB
VARRVGLSHDPEACLVNYYRHGARMGLHRDEDEEDFAAPVVSISLGDTAVFRIGGLGAGRADRSRSGSPRATCW